MTPQTWLFRVLWSFLLPVYPGNALVYINGKTGKLMADQIMTADKNRLKNYIGMLNSDDMVKVAETVRVHLEL
jgi:mRNA interferase MazF